MITRLLFQVELGKDLSRNIDVRIWRDLAIKDVPDLSARPLF